MKKKKIFKILIILALCVIIVGGSVCAYLFIPLKGKKHTEVWAYNQQFDISEIATIKKSSDKPFKILQLTDLQLWFIISDNKEALKLAKETVAETKPDLIVLTGDNVSGLLTNLKLKSLIKAMDSLEIPWAPVFGNHDAEGKASLNWQGDKLLQSKYCLFQKGPSNLYGVGNYAVNIKEDNKIVQTLFFFDNGRYYDYGEDGKGEIYMDYAQLAWYKWNVLGIQKDVGNVVPSMVFSHFAIPEFREALDKHGIKRGEGEVKRIYVPEEMGFGSCAYLPGVSKVNSGFFDLAKELKSTHSMFFGHDHENDASIVFEGIRMTYGLKAGPSPKFWNDAKEYGGTLITMTNKENNYKTEVQHIVMEKAA